METRARHTRAPIRRLAGALGHLLAGCAPIAFAAEPPPFLIDTWTVDDGLPQSAVAGIAQTPDGYLWVGTHKGGLARFDGLQFRVFTPANTPALGFRTVNALFADGGGALWIADLDGHLASCRDGSFTRWSTAAEGPQWRIDRLVAERADEVMFSAANDRLLRAAKGAAELEQVELPGEVEPKSWWDLPGGELWLSDRSDRLWRWRGSGLEELPAAAAPAGGPLRALVSDAAGRVWAGTDAGLELREGGRFRPVALPGAEAGSREPVLQFALSGDGGLWVRTTQRLLKRLGERWVVDLKRELLPPRIDIALHGDAAGGVWQLPRGGGAIFVSAAGRRVLITTGDGLPSPLIDAWFQDREGSVWLGTLGGLVRLRPQLFHAPPVAEGVDRISRSVCDDAEGQVWVGTARGLARLQDGGVEAAVWREDGGPGSISGVTVAPGPGPGELWVGTVGSGTGLRTGDSFGHPFPRFEAGRSIRVLRTTPAGPAWFGGEFGIYRWDGERLLDFTAEHTLPRGNATDLAMGADGRTWMLTGGPWLHRFDGTECQGWQIGGEGEEPGTPLLTVLPDPDLPGVAWIGTMGDGLLHFHDGRFVPLTSDHGLPDGLVSQLVADDRGQLWGGTRRGVFRVALAELREVAAGRKREARFRLYGRESGLPTGECSMGFQPACWKASDGRLWFTTVRGPVVIDPATAVDNPVAPPVVIEGVAIDGEPAALPAGAPAVAADLPDERVLQVPPGRNGIQFRFTAPSFIAADRLRFRWRLEPVESGWIDGGTQRFVDYRALAPGRYRFHVTAANADGIWNQTGTSIPFHVAPRFWERRSVQVGAAVLAALVIGLVVWLVLRRRHRLELAAAEHRRAVESERTRIAQDLHDEIGAGLAQVNLASAMAADPALPREVSTELLGDIGGRARQLVTSLDEIVWAVNPANDNLPSLASYFSHYAQEFLKPTAITCRVDVADGLPAVPLEARQRHSLFLAFAEALHNAVKHSDAETVELSIAAASGELAIIVRDDGRGLPDEAPAAGADGLVNMRERLQALGGRARIDTHTDGGTEVEFTLPLGR